MNTTPPVVLITGALTGIGRATALAFAREGASVVVSGRRDEAGHALAAELRAIGVRAEYLGADVRIEAGVRVNAVAPGPVQTDMLDRFVGGNEDAKSGFLASLPARRAGTPDEIAQTIVFLASDKARFLTGQCVAVDGGFTAQ